MICKSGKYIMFITVFKMFIHKILYINLLQCYVYSLQCHFTVFSAKMEQHVKSQIYQSDVTVLMATLEMHVVSS